MTDTWPGFPFAFTAPYWLIHTRKLMRPLAQIKEALRRSAALYDSCATSASTELCPCLSLHRGGGQAFLWQRKGDVWGISGFLLGRRASQALFRAPSERPDTCPVPRRSSALG